jgi:acyl-CoA hydrolase
LNPASLPASPVPGRPVNASRVEMTEIVYPNDANPLGNCMGGRVMHWIDMCAAIAAGRHARTPVVTASVDKLDFHNPVPVGSIMVLLASVNFAGTTSMEVGVKVFHEVRTTGERRHVASAYLTFVSLNPETGKPAKVPPLIRETQDDHRRWKSAQERRQARTAARPQPKA